MCAGFSKDNVHQKDWHMVGDSYLEPHPNVSLPFHRDIYGNAVKQFGMEMVFFDYLQLRGKLMLQFQDVPPGEEGEHMWLSGATTATLELKAEMQFCMAWAHHILNSVEWPAVTNARANGDGGASAGDLVLSSLLAGMVGLGWSKDNLHTVGQAYTATQQTMLAGLSLGPVGLSDRLTARPDNTSADITTNKTLAMTTCAEDGTLLQPSYPLTPVDRMLTGTGTDPNFASCGCVGVSQSKWKWDCHTNLWATYTSIPRLTAPSKQRQEAAAAAAVAGSNEPAALWFTAVAFSGTIRAATNQVSNTSTANQVSNTSTASASPEASHTSPPPPPPPTKVTIFESDLAPLVDTSCSMHSFSDVPCGSFNGTGATFPSAGAGGDPGAAAPTGYVVWSSDATLFAGGTPQQPPVRHDTGATMSTTSSRGRGSQSRRELLSGCSAHVSVEAWSGAATVTLPAASSSTGFTQLNVAPYFSVPGETTRAGAAIALLGELGKLSAVSTYRFSWVRLAAAPSHALEVGLRGKPGEKVTLLFASSDGGAGREPSSGSDAFGCTAMVATIGMDGSGQAAFSHSDGASFSSLNVEP